MKILSPAKINLFLQITGKRSDGYHNLVTLMCCIKLYDTISIIFGSKETTVTCPDPNVPEDRTNLACKAADLFFKKVNRHEGVKISIEKRIPVSAGLGGGSSNAASVLLELNRHYQYPFSPEELIKMGLSIGADVPFFLFRRPAIATGIGEKLEAYHGLVPYNILLVYPGFGVATADIYNNLNLRLTKCKKINIYALLKQRGFDAERHLCNDLESVAASRYPTILSVKEALLNHGATGAIMTGSGPTVFGLFSDPNKARNAKHALAENSKWQIFLTDMLV